MPFKPLHSMTTARGSFRALSMKVAMSGRPLRLQQHDLAQTPNQALVAQHSTPSVVQ